MVFPLFSLARSPQSTLSVVKTIFFASYITVFLAQTWHAVSAKKCLFCPCWWIRSQVCYILLVRSSFLLLHSTTSHFCRLKSCLMSSRILSQISSKFLFLWPTHPPKSPRSHVPAATFSKPRPPLSPRWRGRLPPWYPPGHVGLQWFLKTKTHTKRKNTKSWYNAYSDK